jgi:hypothetical protein
LKTEHSSRQKPGSVSQPRLPRTPFMDSFRRADDTVGDTGSGSSASPAQGVNTPGTVFSTVGFLAPDVALSRKWNLRPLSCRDTGQGPLSCRAGLAIFWCRFGKVRYTDGMLPSAALKRLTKMLSNSPKSQYSNRPHSTNCRLGAKIWPCQGIKCQSASTPVLRFGRSWLSFGMTGLSFHG